MSRVAIEIDGLRLGMNISAERMSDLIQTLHTVAVESQRDARSNKASDARNAAREAFENMLSEISFASRKSA